ncbi:MAG: DUF2267 domain-containing protein [Gammaproteobacteria bacterium]|nr:DUF2267 domain-containing protein [Gammaproteobacteria bacterium]
MPEALAGNGDLRQVLQRYADADSDRLDARLAELEREWDLDRALEAQAAIAGMATLLLGTARGLSGSWLPLAVFGVLLQHGLKGWSPPVPLLKKLGFRPRADIEREVLGLRLLRGDFHHAPGAGNAEERVARVFEAVHGRRHATRASTRSWRRKFRAVRTGTPHPVRAGRLVAGDIHAENFIEHLRSRWQPADDEQLDETLRAVLSHLKWRLSPGEAEPVFATLPRTIAKAAADAPRRRRNDDAAARRRVDAAEFFDEISATTGLPRKEAEQATCAVFSSMKRTIPAAQNRAMRAVLPKGLKRVWLQA